MTLNAALLIIGVLVGAVILVAALKAVLGPDKKQHSQSDSGGVGYTHNTRHEDNYSGGDGGGGD